MIKTLASIRLKQGFRAGQEVGPVFLLLIGLPFVFYYFVFLWKTAQGEYTLAMALLGAYLMLNTHLFRGDKEFLRLLSNRRIMIYWTEYVLMWSPFMVTFLFTKDWWFSPALLGWAGLVALLPITIRPKVLNLLKLKWLPTAWFEWKSGLRKMGWAYVIVWTVGLALGQHPEATPVTLVVLALIAASFNNWAEPIEFLQLFPLKPISFLRNKLFGQSGIYLISVLPLLLSFLLFHGKYWPVLLAALLLSLATILFSIVFKYALYAPNRDLKKNIWFILFLPICMLQPWTLPIPLVMLVIYSLKSVRNLKYYLE